jgi:monoamine oxidase
MAVRGLFTGDLNETSFLNLLFLVRAHGSLNTLFSIKNGAQENMVTGGAGAIAGAVAAALGNAVHLNAPVRSITQHGHDHVLMETGSATDGSTGDALTVAARHVVVTVPPALALDIVFDPALPTDRRELYTSAVAGPESKTLVVYDEPFWRVDGFSGQTAEPQSVCEVTLDASPMSGRPGVIASFTFGAVARRVDALGQRERRAAVLEALVARFGRRAATPVEFIETPWWTESWTRGCSMAHFPLGTLTRYGHLIREPFGQVHWAGTETATTSYGAIDGAVRSGQRAAQEILNLV